MQLMVLKSDLEYTISLQFEYNYMTQHRRILASWSTVDHHHDNGTCAQRIYIYIDKTV